MDNEARKGPSPWLSPALTATGIAVALIWAYLQMRHWREPDADYLAIAGTISLTLLLWVLLVTAAIRNFRDSRRASSLQAQIVTIKEEYELKLKHIQKPQVVSLGLPFHPGVGQVGRRLESAYYGGEMGTPIEVTERIGKLLEGEEIPVNHDELCQGQDPARGRDKFLTVTFSETLRQGYVYASPRGWLKGNSNVLATEEAIKNAPDLRIDYETDGVKDIFTLANEGPETLYGWNFRRVHIGYGRTLGTAYGNRSIESGHKLRQEMLFEGDGKPLFYFLRENTPANAQATVEAYYEDRLGRRFVREFTLTTYADGKLLFQPGRIMPQ